MVNTKQIELSQRGFSLVEMMVVVAIIGIIAASAIPSYNVWIQNTRIRTTAESILNGLQKARVEALRNNTSVQFTLSTDGSWVVGCANATATCPAAIETKAAAEASANIDIATDSGNLVLTFNGLGIRDPALAANEFDTVSVNMNGMAPADSRNLDIRLGAGGSVKMCDPNLAVTDLRAC